MTAGVVAAGLLAGCGQHGVAGPTKAATENLGTWLLRLDSYSGEDGETKQATYLTIRPTTGDTTVVSTPRLQVAEASGIDRALLVDAGHTEALLDSRPTKADRAAGRLTLYDLGAQGKTRTLDVRRATGAKHLTTDWASFDPNRPGTLRVVDGRTVWVIAPDGTASKESVLPSRPGWIFGGGFNKNTGTPYIEDTGSFDTLPAGNGEMDRRALERDGGQAVLSNNGRFKGLPEATCTLGTAFTKEDGSTWAFCVVGSHVVVKRLASGAQTWKVVGRATPDVVPTGSEPSFVLPAA